MSYFLALALSFSAFVAAAAPPQNDTSFKRQKRPVSISEVLEKYTGKWMKISGVTGTGEGKLYGKPCIMIFTNVDPKHIKRKIPKTVEGFKVVFEESGDIKAR